MVCNTFFKPGQTLTQRKEEIKKVMTRLEQLIASRQVKAKVGPQGAITFEGWKVEDRERITDACAYRRIVATGSSLARAEIARAEQMAGRMVNQQTVAQGVHSHDNGATWHKGH